MDMKIEGLSQEQQEKLDAAETPQDLIALAEEVGYELSEEELDAISGGGWISDEMNKPVAVPHCAYCGTLLEWQGPSRGNYCKNCKAYRGRPKDVVWKVPGK